MPTTRENNNALNYAVKIKIKFRILKVSIFKAECSQLMLRQKIQYLILNKEIMDYIASTIPYKCE